MEQFIFCILACVTQVWASGYENNYPPSPYAPSHIGKCNQNDGFYYLNDGSFMICTNGAAYMQPCAPGTQNAPAQFFSQGSYESQAVFCGVNLISQHYLNYYGINPSANSGYSHQSSYSPPAYQPKPVYSPPAYQPKPSYSPPAYQPPSYQPMPTYSAPAYKPPTYLPKAPTGYRQPQSYSPPKANQKPSSGYPSISIAYKPVVSYSKPAQTSSQTSYQMAYPQMMQRYPQPAKPSYRPAYPPMPAYMIPYLAKYPSKK
ncbi:hypothetical protein CAPTEDRAFT_209357 [Capitella teleta]|uniref:Chitin-binding type-2 domain-containing protein n=1 Tax=Capitella teleta TaxID=283909 RepID=R7TMD7_CAPTE|nr:hypothetical protein CAPTEDRAFT_209357 [Capitella teleta]|eukprot:ELT94697.1 hypothetical protein CAPTEDRAFT_209357 [Capitella teleta]